MLTEPALTNIGIVLPEPGFLEGVRAACDATGTLLVVDETHTFSAGPGGATRRWGLRPDALTIGKSLGGGVPCGAYGLTEELADRVVASAVADGSDLVDVGGVGGTLAGNALSLAAMRAVLSEVLTDDAFVAMEALSDRFADGVQGVIDAARLDWSVTRLGARCEYRFAKPAPRSGGESAAAGDGPLEDYLHLAGVNRGVLITPFHNMALTCPATTRGPGRRAHRGLRRGRRRPARLGVFQAPRRIGGCRASSTPPNSTPKGATAGPAASASGARPTSAAAGPTAATAARAATCGSSPTPTRPRCCRSATSPSGARATAPTARARSATARAGRTWS